MFICTVSKLFLCFIRHLDHSSFIFICEYFTFVTHNTNHHCCETSLLMKYSDVKIYYLVKWTMSNWHSCFITECELRFVYIYLTTL